MSTTIPEAPAGSGRSGTGGTGGLPQVPLRTFNHGLLGRNDPIQGSGHEVKHYGFAATYPVPPEKKKAVVIDLFTTLYARLRANSIPGARVGIVDYKDAATGSGEPPRRYLVVTGETRRSTYMGVFATFRTYGDYLYVSVDAYMLPPLSVMSLLKAIFLAMMFTFAVASFTFGIGIFFIAFPVLFWWYRDVIGSVISGDSLAMALRRRFHAGYDTGTFDNDDVAAYFKCTALLLAEAMKDVFENHGLPVAEVERYQQIVNMSTQVINTGRMDVSGILGGAGNLVRNVART